MEFLAKYGIPPQDLSEEEKILLPLFKKYFEK
jgi:hypothetical protein